MTVQVVDAHAHVLWLVSVVKMMTVLEELLPKSNVLLCISCGQKDSMQRIFINKCFLFTVGSVWLGREILSQTFDSHRWCPTGLPSWECDRSNCAAGEKIGSSWQEGDTNGVATAIGCSHGLAYSIMHDYLKFQKVCARWVPRELKDQEKMDQMCLSLQHLLWYADEEIKGAPLPTRIEACFNAMERSQFTFNQKV
jgi:hypothetical protein